jgi:choline kinase/phosphatidylglycerophosphate synthase
MSVRAPEPGAVGVVGVIFPARGGSSPPDGTNALTIVAGRTLLERAVHNLRAVGIEHVVIVLDDGSESIRAFLSRHELSVRAAAKADISAGDCSSDFFGAHAAGRRFLLVTGDRVFEPEALHRLLASNAPFVLGVDTSARVSDEEKPMKVKLDGARVASVSRDLVAWDALAAGLAVCDAPVAAAAARCLASGETSWNALNRPRLADCGMIEAVDLAGLLCAHVDTPAARRRAERAIVRLAARQPFDGPVFRYVNRRLSWRISLLLVRLGVPAAAATAGAFVIAIVAASVLALGAISPLALVAGGLLVQVAAIADAVNGEVARASLRSTLAGTFFDPVLDRMTDAALLVSLAVAAGLQPATSFALTVALFGTLFGTCVNATYEAVYRRPPPRPILRLSFGHDVRLLAIALFAVALQPFWGLVAVGAIASVESGQRLVAIVARSRIDARAATRSAVH